MDLVELLLHYGAHWWTPDSNHKTPLDLAKMSRAIDCIHVIEAHSQRTRKANNVRTIVIFHLNKFVSERDLADACHNFDTLKIRSIVRGLPSSIIARVINARNCDGQHSLLYKSEPPQARQ